MIFISHFVDLPVHFVVFQVYFVVFQFYFIVLGVHFVVLSVYDVRLLRHFPVFFRYGTGFMPSFVLFL